MKIISFAWTTPALLAGTKTMTRRDWKPEYAASFKAGDLIAAWNRSPRMGRSSGARQVATLRLTKAPYAQRSDAVTSVDYRREGFPWLLTNGTNVDRQRVQDIWIGWHEKPQLLTVVEFQLVEVLM